MKKTLSLVLALTLVLTLAFSMVACGGKDDTKAPETTETPAGTDTQAPVDTDETPVDTDEAPAGDSWGQTLLGVFNDAIAANPAATAEELANAVITHESILFMGGVTPMEAGAEWLPGFNEAPTGWATCASFHPTIGSIAFVGYVFTLEEGADVDAFKATLEANANPRWQICVTADETIIENVGNTVFFLMCPASNNPDVPADEF